jgi:hypothetical protein
MRIAMSFARVLLILISPMLAPSGDTRADLDRTEQSQSRPDRKTIKMDRTRNECDAEGKPAGEWCTVGDLKLGTLVVAYRHPGGPEVPERAPQRIAKFFQEHPHQ